MVVGLKRSRVTCRSLLLLLPLARVLLRLNWRWRWQWQWRLLINNTAQDIRLHDASGQGNRRCYAGARRIEIKIKGNGGIRTQGER